jgi:hypothetical protein
METYDDALAEAVANTNMANDLYENDNGFTCMDCEIPCFIERVIYFPDCIDVVANSNPDPMIVPF